MLGETPAPEDFSGRYKLVWTPEALYLMAELHDDVLIDARPDPLYFYWDDDALEIFVDEDASGGLHQFNDNAYAYHVALDNQSVDIGPYESPEAEAAAQVNFQLFNDHVESVWRRQEAAPHAITWEARILLYPEGSDTPARLEAGKLVGFMLAYCDADDPNGRQHFVGDIEIEPVDGDRNRGYIDASVFGRVRLVESLANDPAL